MASTLKKLALISLHILVVSYLVEGKDMSEGVLSTADLDVAEVLATPVKGIAAQVMNLLNL